MSPVVPAKTFFVFGQLPKHLQVKVWDFHVSSNLNEHREIGSLGKNHGWRREMDQICRPATRSQKHVLKLQAPSGAVFLTPGCGGPYSSLVTGLHTCAQSRFTTLDMINQSDGNSFYFCPEDFKDDALFSIKSLINMLVDKHDELKVNPTNKYKLWEKPIAKRVIRQFTSFQKFPQLPLELQLMIWDIAIIYQYEKTNGLRGPWHWPGITGVPVSQRAYYGRPAIRLRAPAPDMDVFLWVGAHLKKGLTICVQSRLLTLTYLKRKASEMNFKVERVEFEKINWVYAFVGECGRKAMFEGMIENLKKSEVEASQNQPNSKNMTTEEIAET